MLLAVQLVGAAGGVAAVVTLAIRVTLNGLGKKVDRIETKLDDVCTRLARLEGQYTAAAGD